MKMFPHAEDGGLAGSYITKAPGLHGKHSTI